MPEQSAKVREECDEIRKTLQAEERHWRMHIPLPNVLSGIVCGYLSRLYLLDIIERTVPCYDGVYFDIEGYDSMGIVCNNCDTPEHALQIDIYDLAAPCITTLIDLYLLDYEYTPTTPRCMYARVVRRWVDAYAR